MRASDWQRRELDLAGWAVELRSYSIADHYHAEVEVISSGVTVARATEPVRSGAEERALDKALARLQTTRILRGDSMVGG